MVFDYLKGYVDIINSFKTSIWTYCIISPPSQFGGEIDHMVQYISHMKCNETVYFGTTPGALK